jgi:hypothetical protein
MYESHTQFYIVYCQEKDSYYDTVVRAHPVINPRPRHFRIKLWYFFSFIIVTVCSRIGCVKAGPPELTSWKLDVETVRNEIVHCILWIRRCVVLSAQFFVFFHLFHFFLFKNVVRCHTIQMRGPGRFWRSLLEWPEFVDSQECANK